MKDKFISNLAERFADHETSVAPGTWEAISGQMTIAGGETLRQTLQAKFGGHEAPVDAHVWEGISNQLGHGAAAGVGGGAGWWAAGIAATLVTAGFLLFGLSDPETALTVPSQATEPSPQVVEAATMPLSEASSGSTAATSAVILKEVPKATVPENIAAQRSSTGSKASDPKPAVEPSLPDNTASTSPEGPQVVTGVLQGIVDHYVTSAKVVVTEQVPPPTQSEMPSTEVHPQHDASTTEPNEEPEILEPEIVNEASPDIFIPTAFSPDGNGVNDEFVVSCPRYQKALVRIFSATNNSLVFSADNLEAPWNGRVMNSGQVCEPGMYFYALEVTGTDGRTWSKGEVVRLFR